MYSGLNGNVLTTTDDAATVYGGNTTGAGTVLASFTGPGSQTNFGYFLAGGAELTAGGWLDLLAGAPELNRKGAAYILSLP